MRWSNQVLDTSGLGNIISGVGTAASGISGAGSGTTGGGGIRRAAHDAEYKQPAQQQCKQKAGCFHWSLLIDRCLVAGIHMRWKTRILFFPYIKCLIWKSRISAPGFAAIPLLGWMRAGIFIDHAGSCICLDPLLISTCWFPAKPRSYRSPHLPCIDPAHTLPRIFVFKGLKRPLWLQWLLKKACFIWVMAGEGDYPQIPTEFAPPPAWLVRGILSRNRLLNDYWKLAWNRLTDTYYPPGTCQCNSWTVPSHQNNAKYIILGKAREKIRKAVIEHYIKLMYQ